MSQLGCSEALTLGVTVYDRPDSGELAGHSLGLEVEAYRHPMGASIPDLNVPFEPELAEVASEFIATPGLGDEVFLVAFEPALPDTLLFNGGGGDSRWADDRSLRPGMPDPGTYGLSIAEFRLRVGFAWASLPFVGTRFPAPLNELRSSKELDPYRLGTDYERAIARRIAEDAGVPWDFFGQVKRAVAPHPSNQQRLFPAAMAATMRRYAGWTDGR